MKLLFLLQTHNNIPQIKYLVDKLVSKDSEVLISHDYSVSKIDKIEGARVIARKAKGVRGDWSLVQDYINAIEYILESKIEFDWLINLSGQDLPIKPLGALYSLLAQSKVDGYMHYFPAFEETAEWGIKESDIRYNYKYSWTGTQLPPMGRLLVKPFKVVINNTQPFIRLETSYSLMLGRRLTHTPFNQDFKCYAGSFFKTLNYKAVKYLYKFYQTNVEIVDYYKRTCNADESFIQTALLNNPELDFDRNNLMFYDFEGTKHGRPNILTMAHLPLLTGSTSHYFARKFNPLVDSSVIHAVTNLL